MLAKPFFFLILIFGAFCWNGCIPDDCCPCTPESAIVHRENLDTTYKQFLPYYKLDTLIYDATYDDINYGQVVFTKTFEGYQYFKSFDQNQVCDSLYREYYLFKYESDAYPHPLYISFFSHGFEAKIGPYGDFFVSPVLFYNRNINGGKSERILDSLYIHSKVYLDVYHADEFNDSTRTVYYNKKYGYLKMEDTENNELFKLIKAI